MSFRFYAAQQQLRSPLLPIPKRCDPFRREKEKKNIRVRSYSPFLLYTTNSRLCWSNRCAIKFPRKLIRNIFLFFCFFLVETFLFPKVKSQLIKRLARLYTPCHLFVALVAGLMVPSAPPLIKKRRRRSRMGEKLYYVTPGSSLDNWPSRYSIHVLHHRDQAMCVCVFIKDWLNINRAVYPARPLLGRLLLSHSSERRWPFSYLLLARKTCIAARNPAGKR